MQSPPFGGYPDRDLSRPEYSARSL